MLSPELKDEKSIQPEKNDEVVATYDRLEQVALRDGLGAEQDAYYVAIGDQFEQEWYGSREADKKYADDLQAMTEAVDAFARGDLVEIGAGSGHWTLRCVNAGARVTVVEPSETMRSVTRRRLTSAGKTARLMLGRSEAIPLGDHKMDRCLMAFVLSHLDAATRDATFKEIARVLRPGGELLLMDNLRPPDAPAALVVRRVVNAQPFRVLRVQLRPEEVAAMIDPFARVQESKTLNHTWILRVRLV
jgi:ubiquinone/menaquinone biosynthesis C-methylase UbiE